MAGQRHAITNRLAGIEAARPFLDCRPNEVAVGKKSRFQTDFRQRRAVRVADIKGINLAGEAADRGANCKNSELWTGGTSGWCPGPLKLFCRLLFFLHFVTCNPSTAEV
jgi:hypothetical protein